ncbi:MAG: hypothetical protein GY757_00380, partial [bacterium]|nr:hypothetical protein [bacterium]
FEVDERETDALVRLAKENDVSFYMVLLAVFNVFLSKLWHPSRTGFKSPPVTEGKETKC